MTKYEEQEKLTDEIWEWSDENSCGILIDKSGIYDLVDRLWNLPLKYITLEKIEYYMEKFESDEGRLVKSQDIMTLFRRIKKKNISLGNIITTIRKTILRQLSSKYYKNK